MSILDEDERLSKMLELKPFHDWLNPTEYGRRTVSTPESVFQQAERVEGGVVVRDMQVERQVTLAKGLHVEGVQGGELHVSGLVKHSLWEMSAETKEVVDANRAAYNRLTKDAIPEDLRDILNENRQMRGWDRAVWELDASFTQDELVRLGLAQERKVVKTIGEEFIPDPIRPTEGYDHQAAVQEVADKLKHEAVNVYGDQGVFGPYLSPTWWMFLEELETEMAEFDDIRESKESLRETLFERLNLEPGMDFDGGPQRMMGARYELPTYGEEIIYRDAMLDAVEKPLAWVDFLAGFPYGCCEMLTLAGEVTTRKEDWPSYPDEDMPVPPVPEKMFDEETYTEKKTAHNLMWLENERVDAFADGVSGEPEPDVPNWWLRINFVGDEKYPYPGEFLGLGVRIFPNLIWGKQKNSPFLYGGHWIDTAYITSGEATIVEKDSGGFYLCQLDWRKEENMKVYPSDFAEYKVGDRVTIMKDVNTTKTSQLWKDEDCFKPDKDKWRIVPLTYYGKGFDEEEA